MKAFGEDVGGRSGSCRRIGVYAKSLARLKLERERRRQVRVLAEQGFSQREIASKLGVCVRTVKRDWLKSRAYVKGERKKALKQLEEERQKLLQERCGKLGGNDRIKVLAQDQNPNQQR